MEDFCPLRFPHSSPTSYSVHTDEGPLILFSEILSEILSGQLRSGAPFLQQGVQQGEATPYWQKSLPSRVTQEWITKPRQSSLALLCPVQLHSESSGSLPSPVLV